MGKKYNYIYLLPPSQRYRIESIGAKSKWFDRLPTFNLRGLDDGFLYRRVFSTHNLQAIYDAYGLGSIFEILEPVQIGEFKVINLKFIGVEKSPEQLNLFDI